MTFATKDLLDAVGPPAALVFAAWIYMSFLQQRYLSAFSTYRSLISGYRENKMSNERHSNIKQQIFIYKRRCQIMKLATNIGLVAAIFLILTLINAEIDVVFPSLSFLKYVVAVCAIAGLMLVIVGAALVMQENSLVQEALDSEIADVPDLADHNG